MKIPRSGLRGLALKEAAPDLARTINWVRDALDKKLNADVSTDGRKWFDLDVIYEDHAVITMSGRSWSYPYTISDGVVSIGEPHEVVESYSPIKESAPLDVDLRLVEAEGGETGTVWEATLIVAGLSANSAFYSDLVLREAAPRFDGVRICMKSDAKHRAPTVRDIGDVIGWAESPRFVEGASRDTGRIVATLNLPGLPDNTRNLLVAAARAGKQNIAGLSIDAYGDGPVRLVEGKRVRVPSNIARVESVDLIVEPGAGGRLIRLLEAAPASSQPGDPDMNLRESMLRFIEAKAPEAYKKLNLETVSDDELETAYREAVAGTAKPATPAPALDLAATEERIRMIEARASARAAIDGSTLPQPAKDRLQREFATRERFAEADVTAAIQGEREYLARFVESGRVNLGDFDAVRVEDRSVKIGEMLDAFFDPAHRDHRSVQSFKEAYIEITGDRFVTGRLADCDRSRLRESLGRFAEALDSTSWSDALGDSITRRMQAVFTGLTDLQAWRRVATVGRVNDFRTQERIRIGGYGNLPIVGEDDSYDPLTSPGDAKATYAIAKRGGTESVTREMILNDDVNAIRRIPIELALAAGNTLYEFVFDFYRTNLPIYDGKALYHVDHKNLFTAPLDAAQFAAHRLAMVTQQRAGSGKRLGAGPGTVLVPFELQEVAYNLFVRNQNLDKTYVQSINPEVIPVSYWTAGKDWVTVADQMVLPVLEISFLNGQEEPELFVQDIPNVGSVFTNDKVTYKIRHEYGGVVLVDGEKGTTKAVVA